MRESAKTYLDPSVELEIENCQENEGNQGHAWDSQPESGSFVSDGNKKKDSEDALVET